jgi:outer membrane protein OmpA-like peptidoglycan-associated protein
MDESAAVQAGGRVIITNKSGKELMSTKPDNKGGFVFRLIKEDRATLTAMTVTDAELRVNMRGTLTGADSARTPLANTKINMVNDQGVVIQSVTTDERGGFVFVNIPADQAFVMTVENVTDVSLLSYGKLYVNDEKGKVVKTLRLGSAGKFEFRVLPIDRLKLGTVYVDDPWLQVLQMKAKAQKDSMLIIENIYYDYNDFKILPAAEITLEKVVTVMKIDPSITIEISSHTDARSSSEYNQKLSQKRAQAVVDYLVRRGVDRARLKPVGYGETKLLNRCLDNVECSEEEHAKNRRTEFKISHN